MKPVSNKSIVIGLLLALITLAIVGISAFNNIQNVIEKSVAESVSEYYKANQIDEELDNGKNDS